MFPFCSLAGLGGFTISLKVCCCCFVSLLWRDFVFRFHIDCGGFALHVALCCWGLHRRFVFCQTRKFPPFFKYALIYIFFILLFRTLVHSCDIYGTGSCCLPSAFCVLCMVDLLLISPLPRPVLTLLVCQALSSHLHLDHGSCRSSNLPLCFSYLYLSFPC